LDITDYEKVVCLSDVDLLKDLPIDIVINNAGSYGTKENTLDNLDPYEWIDVFKINTIAPIIVSKALMKNLVKGTRKIIANISSIKGSMSLNEEGGKYIYASSKAALNFSTKKLSIDLKDQGITVVSINPGWIKTRMSHPNGQIETSKSAQAIINILQKISLKDSGKFINYDGNIISW
jgi:short-subunit dehydrogenase